MCTAITYKTEDFYFGRTLDVERLYNENVTVTPRNYPLSFRLMPTVERHLAIIGMATVANGYPLYYEAANEKGLCMAGLNFPGNAKYFPPCDEKDNVAPFEFIPFVLSQCDSLAAVRELLCRINLAAINFSRELPLAPLHWIIADSEGAITVECMAEGLKVYENPIGVLTNNPPFDYHLTHLCDYMNLTSGYVENRFGDAELSPYCLGMGSIGLPGDYSSSSRFVRAAFVKLNSVCGVGEDESVSQFFHILGAVEQQRGVSHGKGGTLEVTEYTSCINASRGIYYYSTYSNGAVCTVDMHSCDLEGSGLYTCGLVKDMQYIRQELKAN